jgi:hypothetical protein
MLPKMLNMIKQTIMFTYVTTSNENLDVLIGYKVMRVVRTSKHNHLGPMIIFFTIYLS